MSDVVHVEASTKAAKIPKSLASAQSFDLSGIVLSVLCLIHCLGLPFLLFLAPSFVSQEGHGFIHWVFFSFIFPVAVYSFRSGYKLHRSLVPTYVGSTGLFILLFTLLSESAAQAIGRFELELNVLGSLFLVAGHIINIRKCRCLKHGGCEHD